MLGEHVRRWALVLVLVCSAVIVARSQATLSMTFEEGVTLLESRRDYRGAARLFERVAKEGDRSLAARALLHLGTCYERLKDGRAASTYQRIVAEYPEQGDVVREARVRLAAFAPSVPPHRMSRPLWQRERPGGIIGRPSYDGRLIPTVGPGGISLLDVETGVSARPIIALATEPGGRRVCEPTALPPALSPDAAALVLVCERHGIVELQHIEVERPTAPRTMLRLSPGETALLMEWTRPSSLLIQITTGAHQNRLVTVELASGAATTVAEPPAPAAGASLSPDGRWILFDGPASAGVRERAIWVARAGRGEPRAAITTPLNDRFPHWTPDGTAVVFISDRTGAPGVWLQQISRGTPTGQPRQLTPNIGSIIAPLGLTRAGRLVYWVETGLVDAYVVPLDPGGAPAGAARGLATRPIGQNQMPTWSSDGGRVAFIARDRGIVVREVATGSEALFGSALVSATQPRFSPDGQIVMVRAWNSEGQHGIFRIDTRTSAVTPLKVVSPDDESRMSPGRWSRDGRSMLFVLKGQILRVDVETRAEQVIHTFEPGVQVFTPDVSRVDDAMVFVEVRGGIYSLMMRDATGAFHKLHQGVAGELMRTPAWLPGNGGVIFSRAGRDAKGLAGWTGLWRLDLASKELSAVVVDGLNPRDPAVSPDGRHLAFTAGTASREIYVLENFLPTRNKSADR